MRRAIINADDFGLSPGVNRGIVTAFREGVLSSATMMVNMVGFKDGVERARAQPDLPLGIHLTLLWGAPITDPQQVPSLIAGQGQFPNGLGTLARRYFGGRLSLDEVQTEFRSQVRRFLDAGLVPTHFDTHKHVHCLPGILSALVAVAAEFGVERVRLPIERRPAGGAAAQGRAPWMPVLKNAIIRGLCRKARATLETASIRTTDHFAGIESTGRLDAATLVRILDNLEPGVTEIMSHPGYMDEAARRYARAGLQRELELDALLDPGVRRRLASGGIGLIDFGQI